jgi:hypothetical protein
MKKEAILILVFSMLFIGLATFAIADNDSGDLNDSNHSLVCTQEAKLCSDGSYVSRNSNNGCKFNECPEYNETIVGASCGTVTPGYQNECCENKGYDEWDAEEFACIKSNETRHEDENETDEDDEDECDSWNCAHWTACVNGTQTRTCTKVANCTENVNEIPKTNKSCFEKERIREHYNNSFECPENCTCTGSTVKCEFGDGRTMTVYAGKSGNIIVQIKGINSSTNVTLYKTDGDVHGVFHGEDKKIFLPDEVVGNLTNHTRRGWHLENASLNLTDDGYYLVQTKKHSRLFWLIPVRENMKAQVDAETGEIIKIRNPWWGFLARDNREK